MKAPGRVVKIRPRIKCCFECTASDQYAARCGRSGRPTRFERSVEGLCGPTGMRFRGEDARLHDEGMPA